MTKKEVSTILSRATKEQVMHMANEIREAYEITLVKEPQKTLVMVKVRETIKRSLFYLGEVLACECMVYINGAKGFGVVLGDDFEKVLAIAIIDGAINGGLQQQFQIFSQIEKLGQEQQESRGKLNTEIVKSRVNFNVMGE